MARRARPAYDGRMTQPPAPPPPTGEPAPDAPAAQRWRLQVQGRVQGVGFRHHVTQQALARGLQGWVRNRHDGSVELVVHATADELHALRRWLQHGVPWARVDTLWHEPLPPPWEPLDGFQRRPTA